MTQYLERLQFKKSKFKVFWSRIGHEVSGGVGAPDHGRAGDMGRDKEFGLLATPLGQRELWGRHLFLKHDENEQRILTKSALLVPRLRNHLRSVEWEVKPLQLMTMTMVSTAVKVFL